MGFLVAVRGSQDRVADIQVYNKHSLIVLFFDMFFEY